MVFSSVKIEDVFRAMSVHCHPVVTLRNCNTMLMDKTINFNMIKFSYSCVQVMCDFNR